MKKGVVILIVVIALLLAYYFIIYKNKQEVKTKPSSTLNILQNQQVEEASLPFPKPKK